MLIAMLSGKAAPGVTTSTWALGLTWPGEVLAVDADPAGGDMLAGLLAGRVSADQGLLSWSVTTRRAPAMEAAALIAGHTVSLPEAPQLWVMPGLQSSAQSSSLVGGGWERLARALERESFSGRDVLVDCGRLSESSPWPVISTADRVLLVARGTVRSVYAARQAASLLGERLGDLEPVGLLAVGGGPYPAGTVAAELGVPVAGELPEDRSAAAALSDGAYAGVRGLGRTRLQRAARQIAERLYSASAIHQHEQAGVTR